MGNEQSGTLTQWYAINGQNKGTMNKEQERERIGQRIADLRKEKSMTQQGLADIVGMQRNHISRIEAGKYSVGFDTLQAIAEALGGTIDIIV